MGWNDVEKKDLTPKEKETIIKNKDERIKELQLRLKTGNFNYSNRVLTGIFGIESTGKSGIVLNYIAKKLKENPNIYARVIDIDGGFSEILNYYDDDIKNRCYVNNPLVLIETVRDDGQITYDIDYIQTFNNVKRDLFSIKELRDNHDTDCQVLVLDGLGNLLNYCSEQMKMEKHLDATNGVNMLYWKLRNKYFLDLLELAKTLPIDVFFIGHTDFLRTDDGKELSAVRQKTLAMLHQIIETTKDADKISDKISLKAKIQKSKYNILEENQTYIFAEKSGKEFWFDCKDIFSKLKMQKKTEGLK